MKTIIILLSAIGMFFINACENATSTDTVPVVEDTNNEQNGDRPTGLTIIQNQNSVSLSEPLTIGDQFPEYNLRFRDYAVNLAEPGEPVVIKLWATWCSICRSIEPSYNEYVDGLPESTISMKFSYDRNFQALSTYLNDNGDNGLHVYDGDNDNQLLPLIGKSGIPNILVIDAFGTVQYIGPFNPPAIDVALNGE
jgi:thiol-disulfide isomerase/thioredoxin